MTLPFEFMVIITVTWVLFGAIFLMPHFAERKMSRKGGRIDTLEQGFHQRLTGIDSKIDSKIVMLENTVNARVNDLNVHVADVKEHIDAIEFPTMPKIPDNIPDMGQITKLIEDGRANTLAVLEDVQLRLSKNMQAIDANIPLHIETGVKKIEGRMYRAKGIVQHDFEKGMDAAKEVILQDIENPEDKTPIMQIVRHFVKIAADAELIDPESADQKIGLVQGIMEGVKMFQNRGNSTQGGSSFPLPRAPTLSSHGDQYDGYYR